MAANISNKEVLAVGLILVGVCAIVRKIYEEKRWIKMIISFERGF